MYESVGSLETIINQAVAALVEGGDGLLAALDALPAPIYVTDAGGLITHFNSACIDFAGRMPVPGKDRWCVTWKLYTCTGEFIPHDSCPMADAILQKRAVRGAVAVAERPDGTRVFFQPYPTPIFDEDGTLRCAINMLIDVTDQRQAEALRVQAQKCRRHARSIDDARAALALNVLADEYDGKADELEQH
jgi:PAS domain-containing protein